MRLRILSFNRHTWCQGRLNSQGRIVIPHQWPQQKIECKKVNKMKKKPRTLQENMMGNISNGVSQTSSLKVESRIQHETTRSRGSKKGSKANPIRLFFVCFLLVWNIHIRLCLYWYLFTSILSSPFASSPLPLRRPRCFFFSCWAFPSCVDKTRWLVSKLSNGLNQHLTSFGYTRFKSYQLDSIMPIREFTTTALQLRTKKLTDD